MQDPTWTTFPLGAAPGNNRASGGVLQEGGRLRRERKGGDTSSKRGPLGRRPSTGRGWRPTYAEGRVPEALPDVLQDDHEHPSFQLEAFGRASATRVVVRAYWDGEEQDRVGEASCALSEICEQVVGWVLRSRGCGDRGMGAEERHDGEQTQDLGGSVPFSGGDQGWYTASHTTYESYRDE